MRITVTTLILLGLGMMATHGTVAHGQPEPPLRLEKTIALPNVQGRIDHLAVDLAGSRLFLAALGNNTVEVIDIRDGKHIRSIKGFQEPQGLIYFPKAQRLIVTNGGDGSCKVLDGKSFELLYTIKYDADADNIRYDPYTNQVYVAFGGGSIGTFDADTGQQLWSVALGGHPESFQLEEAGTRVFVNVPSLGKVIVIDKAEKRITTSWPLNGTKNNFPMALDAINHRLFVGCRNPSIIVIFDTESGKPEEVLNIPGDVDDLHYDRKGRRLYASCGEGYIAVFKEAGGSRYELIAEIPTVKKARTSLFVPEQGRLYLAVPRRGEQQAEIRVYTVD